MKRNVLYFLWNINYWNARKQKYKSIILNIIVLINIIKNVDICGSPKWEDNASWYSIESSNFNLKIEDNGKTIYSNRIADHFVQ
jgi:hypothetical protein